jgi:hypothetical protein
MGKAGARPLRWTIFARQGSIAIHNPLKRLRTLEPQAFHDRLIPV